MIRTTLGQIVNAEKALGELAKQRLPAKVAYQVAKIIKAAAEEIAHFNTQKNALITELGEEKDGRFMLAPDSANIPEFLKRANELAAVDVKLDVTPVSLDVLGEMSAGDLLALGDIVDAGEAPAKARPKLKSVRRA